MVFRSMMTVNAKRPIAGDYKAQIHHAPQRPNLVILDVSGSMTEETIAHHRRGRGGAVVQGERAPGHRVQHHHLLGAGRATTPTGVLAEAEYGGTHYETLAPLLEQDWGVVVTVADYDSSRVGEGGASPVCTGDIELVLDISLVDWPTYLAEWWGSWRTEVKPLLVAETDLSGTQRPVGEPVRAGA